MRVQMQTIRLFIGILFSLVLALGCASGPLYRVKYDYLAPESAEGRGCTQPCETTKIQCEEIINRQVEQEKIDSRQAYQRCLLSQNSAATSPILCFEPLETIPPDYSNCLADYNRCFQGCGGRVEERKVCVRNCR
jgi:hypothetical protein